LVLVLRVLVAKHDGRSMRVCSAPPNSDDQVDGIAIDWIADVCDLSVKRVERVFKALKFAGFEIWKYSGDGARRLPSAQPRKRIEAYYDQDGNWHPEEYQFKPAIRLLHAILFQRLGLAVEHEIWRRKRINIWRAKRAQAAGAGASVQRPGPRRPPSQPESTGPIIALFAPPLPGQKATTASSAAMAASREAKAAAERHRQHEADKQTQLERAKVRNRLFLQIVAEHQGDRWTREQILEELARRME
jgi:hypothetical protein